MKKVFSLMLASAVIGGSAVSSVNSEAREWRIPVGVYAGLSGFGVKAGFEWRWIGIYGTAASSFGIGANVNLKIGEGKGDSVLFSGMKIDLSTQDYGIDLRVRPFQGAFHIDIGYHYYNYKLSANIKNASVNIDELVNSNNFGTVSGALSGKISMFKGWRPYFGFGWDWNLIAQLHLTLDIGAMYVGKYDIGVKTDLSAMKSSVTDAVYNEISSYAKQADITGATLSKALSGVVSAESLNSWKSDNDVQDNTKLSKEQIESVSAYVSSDLVSRAESEANSSINKNIKNINDLLNKIKIFPMIKIGVTYKF